jgi:hypothetical protein
MNIALYILLGFHYAISDEIQNIERCGTEVNTYGRTFSWASRMLGGFGIKPFVY